jgi:hypothetical protein
MENVVGLEHQSVSVLLFHNVSSLCLLLRLLTSSRDSLHTPNRAGTGCYELLASREVLCSKQAPSDEKTYRFANSPSLSISNIRGMKQAAFQILSRISVGRSGKRVNYSYTMRVVQRMIESVVR